jgi:hypothetical protein
VPHALYDANGLIVDGYFGVSLEADSSWFGGFDRRNNVVENDADIWLLFGDVEQPTCECGYCGDKFKTRSRDKALRWFRAHDCSTLFAAEQSAIVYDLTDNLRQAA